MQKTKTPDRYKLAEFIAKNQVHSFRELGFKRLMIMQDIITFFFMKSLKVNKSKKMAIANIDQKSIDFNKSIYNIDPYDYEDWIKAASESPRITIKKPENKILWHVNFLPAVAGQPVCTVRINRRVVLNHEKP